MLRTNVISTGIFVEAGDVISFEYIPRAVNRGLIIATITVLIGGFTIFGRQKISKLRRGQRKHES